MKMEMEMESVFNGGGCVFAPPLTMPVDDKAYIDGEQISFRDLLSLSLNTEEQRPLLQLSQAIAVRPNVSGSPENPTLRSSNAFPSQSALTPLSRLGSDGVDLELKLKGPQQEFGSNAYDNRGGAISTDIDSNFSAHFPNDFGLVRHFPDLRSLENQPIPVNTDFRLVRHFPDLRSLEIQPVPVNTDFGFRPPPYIPEKTTRNYQIPTNLYHPREKPALVRKRSESRSSKLARVRRQKQGEKIRQLEKLMPWERKMERAKMLEEAYKYVKFLQAQVMVLQSMPVCGDLSSLGNFGPGPHSTLGPIAELNRQRMLFVAVNSPVAQRALYSKGCCICSAEQLALLAERIVSG
ncbi:unnamed protein product [Cuscuta epithymum]|uniref:BHLH domain-containing protein n=1 Tax=Cuscuta epithymum TaxID=186058 RepID=A0AAV0G2U2_9ASTE|nr:unnamed protein product [Cuscuta epithymum]